MSKKYYRTWPTLDITRDILAGSREEAEKICSEETDKIITEACGKLMDLGYFEGGADPVFITDEWEEDDD